MYRKKIAVVTGATGLMGMHLILQLQNRYTVYAITRPGSHRIRRMTTFENLKIIESNLISDSQSVINNVDIPSHIDVFFHMAWQGARGEESNDEVVQSMNVKATVSMAEIALKKGASAFIGAGSQAEYIDTDGIITEDTPYQSASLYGKSKTEAYLRTKEVLKGTNTKLIWPRFFSLYGDYDDRNCFISRTLIKALNDDPLEFTLGVQQCDYLYAGDASRALVSLYENGNEGCYNVAYGSSRPLSQYIEEMIEMTGSRSNRSYGKIPYSDGKIHNRVASNLKLLSAVNWKPETSFKEGIYKTISYLKG